MIRNLRWAAVFIVLCLAVGVSVAFGASAEDVPRMTKETLKENLENQDFVILDVRLGKDWDASEFKIKEAVRYEPYKFDAWKDSFSKEKTLVLYCA